MTIEIISDVAFVDPSNTIPYLELDQAIVRPLTKGLLDFSNTETYAGSGVVASGTTFKSLTSDLGAATAGATLGTVSNGMLSMGSAASAFVTLPNTFKLASTCKKFMAILWVKLPATGWPATGSTSSMLMGYASNSTTLAQWGLMARSVLATGIPDAFLFHGPASGSSSASVAISGADVTALFDGNLHQVAFVWDGSTPGTITRSAYIDKAAKTLSVTTSAWDNTFNVPDAVVRMGVCPAFQTAQPTEGIQLGRPSLWDLTGSTAVVADIIQADWDAAQGYLS